MLKDGQLRSPQIAIDVKNMALYGRGISGFVKPLLQGWLSHSPTHQFHFIGPEFDKQPFASYKNWTHEYIAWPHWLPRVLRHPFYDNVLFPKAISRLSPDLVYSPYHDVLTGSRTGAKSIVTVHDTCLEDLPSCYPAGLRWYLLFMLRKNLSHANHILTVSEASRRNIVERYGIPYEHISVVYNTLDPQFEREDSAAESAAIRERFGGRKLLFYSGGVDWRKNIGRLVLAFAYLICAGEPVTLLVTGGECTQWKNELIHIVGEARRQICFVGELSISQLRAHYVAADAVVYPSLCEGFGRVCLEAKAVGTPIACSDIDVLRELCGDCAFYFNPTDQDDIVRAILQALARGRHIVREDDRFIRTRVVSSFLSVMDKFVVD